MPAMLWWSLGVMALVLGLDYLSVRRLKASVDMQTRLHQESP